jgi:hypothetical protein
MSRVQQRACSLFFSTWRGFFTFNLFLLTLRSTLTFTHIVMFWDAWEKMCDEKHRNFGATTTGSFIITIRPPRHPWKPQSLWLTTWLSFPILPTHRT